MLNCSYNLGLRGLKGYIPSYPVGTAQEVAAMMAEFVPIARTVLGLKDLKIITFGPRPQDFFACNAPIQGLYQLGVEIEENSELDLLAAYRKHENDPRIPDVCADMAREMGEGKYYPDLSARMAQFELTLLDWAQEHKGSRKYVAFADKCWPAFPEEFGFEPCYVNSRLVSRGSRSLRGGHLRRFVGVYRYVRFRGTGDPAGHQQQRAFLSLSGGHCREV